MRGAFDGCEVALEQPRETTVRTEPVEQRVEADRVEPSNTFIDCASQFDKSRVHIAESMAQSCNGVRVDVLGVAPREQLVEHRARLASPPQLHEAGAFERAHPWQPLRDYAADLVLLERRFEAAREFEGDAVIGAAQHEIRLQLHRLRTDLRGSVEFAAPEANVDFRGGR